MRSPRIDSKSATTSSCPAWLGTAVLGGMLASTVLGLFLVPVFFLLVRSWFQSRSRQHTEAAEAGSVQHDYK